MIVLAGSIRIAPGKRDAALALIAPMVKASQAEPGCLAYHFAFDVADDHLVRIFEVFVDEDALAAHRASDHMRAWRAGWPEAGIGDRRMMRYEVSAARAT